MKKTTILLVMFLFVFCSDFTVLFAQQDGQPDDPAAQLAAEDRSAAEDQSTNKDISEYTDAELLDLYLNDPQNLPEMSDEQLAHLTDLAMEQ